MILVKKATERELESVKKLGSMMPGNNSRDDFLANAVSAGQCLVARIKDIVVGFGIADRSFYGQGFISLLMVHPEHRRRGVATTLIHHIESLCTTEKLFISTNESNITAQHVFEACGFVKSGYIENLDEGDPEIIYFKRLADR